MNWTLVKRSTPTTSNNSNMDPSEQDGEAMVVTTAMAMAAPTDHPIPRPPMTATVLILLGLFYVFGILFGYVSEINDGINENKCDSESEFENVNSGDLCDAYDYLLPTTAPVNNLTSRARQQPPPNCLKFIVILLEYVFGNEMHGNENEIGLELEFKNVNCYFNFCDCNSLGKHGYNFPSPATTPTTAANNPTPFPPQPSQVISFVVEIICGILLECVFGNEINENGNDIGLKLKREFKKVNVDCHEYYYSKLSATTQPSPAPTAAHRELFALLILHVNHVIDLISYIPLVLMIGNNIVGHNVNEIDNENCYDGLIQDDHSLFWTSYC